MTNLTLTPAAAKFIQRMVRFSGEPAGAGFRLQVTAGGCSGLSSEFTVEAQPKTGDAVVEVDGVRFFLPAESRLLLEGVTVDFADTPTKSGLTFIDPKQAPCACSSSAPSGVVQHSAAHGHGHAMPGVATVGLDAIRRS